ncbi:hypothetical protein [Spongiivirga citrea]|uniref:Calx-beta domain-containing protein n=1 Tax=Spongiivirga citrea TaxID=1481457 RepID=A0A6M0CYA1_9FLAO|nr:hypothetical protein [Spongiivirga citrea]NER18680.1 hypothetical protein [Spongiivirga citrea]
MKKLVYTLLIGLIICSCDKDSQVTADSQGDQFLLGFDATSFDLPVTVDGVSEISVPVGISNVSDTDRSFTISVDESSTASSAEYTIPSTFVVPAGENIGTFVVTGNFDAVPDAVTNTIVVNIDEVTGGVLNSRPSATISIFRFCPSDLAGTYVAVSSGTSTDGAPVNNPITNFEYTVEVTQNEDGTYSISDGVAGVYQDWYCAPYGYCFETAGNFKDVCGQLSGSWVEAFGSTVVLTGQDNADGTLTISWENGFGDTATATYTKQ